MTGANYYKLEEIPWPSAEANATAPRELVQAAEKVGARRKFLARGEGGFHSQYSEFPPRFTVPPHTHDHNEIIVLLEGSCTMLGGGPTLRAGDSMVLTGGYEYGFTAGEDGMRFMTIRTAPAETKLV